MVSVNFELLTPISFLKLCAQQLKCQIEINPALTAEHSDAAPSLQVRSFINSTTMKWFVVIFLSIFSLQEIKAQCPPGTTLTYVFTCDFHLHRPKFNCEKGFWFCCKEKRWDIKCLPNYHVGSVGYIYGRIIDGDYMEFHFPNEIVKKQNFTKEEVAVFNVDDPLEFENEKDKIQLITGDYPTIQLKEELIVRVPFKKL